MRIKMLEKKIPPVAVFLIFSIAMYLIAIADHSRFLETQAIALAGIILGALGVLAALVGVIQFKWANTTVNPIVTSDSKDLVTTGIYAFTRNPMYLGLFLLLLGWGLWLASPLAISVSPLFVFYITIFQIRPEEQALLEIFGDKYLRYKKDVRRWL